MNDWRTALRETDPAARAQLSNDDAQAMRRAVLSAVPPSTTVVMRAWMQPLLVAATIALMVSTGAVAGRRASQEPGPGPSATGAARVADATDEQAIRQLQFATPGGTRIIWVFNSQFDLNESIP